MSEQPLVYAIVLAWNQLNETLECLESLYKQTYSALRIVLADNGSTDGTMETVATRFPSVEICRQEKNAGISGGYNLGIEYALRSPCDYILVMNNDTVADREMVAELVRAFQDQPTTGMVTPKIYHYYNDQNRL